MNTSLKPGISCLIADDYDIDRLTVVAQLRKYPFSLPLGKAYKTDIEKIFN